ncbi:hypothetical protein [Streptomyces sp. NPDC012510]|uniref:hypothetical protein n=1 Tax=Streptomyces sp. NPDC012510 TaxID=3364838 RepID=UPI0036E767F6
MTTGGALRPWAVLTSALLTGALVAACTASGATGRSRDARDAPGGGAADARSSASASPSATPPEELCTKLVAYWSRETLDGDTYGDYQAMGLSNGQYDILREVVDAARTERERAGRAAAERLIDRRARTGCQEWYRAGGPGERPWR